MATRKTPAGQTKVGKESGKSPADEVKRTGRHDGFGPNQPKVGPSWSKDQAAADRDVTDIRGGMPELDNPS